MALPRWELSDLKADETMPPLGRSRTSRLAFATKPSPVKSSSAHEYDKLLRRLMVEPVAEFTLKGIRRPMLAYNVLESSPSKPN